MLILILAKAPVHQQVGQNGQQGGYQAEEYRAGKKTGKKPGTEVYNLLIRILCW